MHPQRQAKAVQSEPQPDTPRRTGLANRVKTEAIVVRTPSSGWKRTSPSASPQTKPTQATPKLPACRLIADAAVEPGAQDVEFRLAHRALEPQQQTIVVIGRTITPSASAISVLDRPHRSMSRYQSALLRANLDASNPTRERRAQGRPRRSAARSRIALPRRAGQTEVLVDHDTRSVGHPSSPALCTKAYCRSVDLRDCLTWAALDWRR